jgi:DnaK suppressor protein
MSNAELAKQAKKKLLDLLRSLEQISATGDASAAVVELDQSRVGRLSRMDAMQAQAMAKASGARRESTKRKISAALRRIDSGDYGTCKACERPVDPRRLNADPTALYCIDCAGLSEQQR